jgi:hypothetical protein
MLFTHYAAHVKASRFLSCASATVVPGFEFNVQKQEKVIGDQLAVKRRSGQSQSQFSVKRRSEQ